MKAEGRRKEMFRETGRDDEVSHDFNNTDKIKVLETQTFQRSSQTCEASRYCSVSTAG